VKKGFRKIENLGGSPPKKEGCPQNGVVDSELLFKQNILKRNKVIAIYSSESRGGDSAGNKFGGKETFTFARG
jgi:hypothetical protein